MSRGQIFAGKAAILVSVQDVVDKGLFRIKNKLNMFANSIGSLGSGSLRGGLLGGIASGYLMKGFIDFSDELLNLQTKLGYFGNLTLEQKRNMDLLTNTIRQLGRTTSFTSREVAQAAVELAQAGFSVKEINDSLQATLDLSRGAGYDLAESAAMMANAIRTFNLSTTQASLVVSQFVRATRLGTIGIEDLREALKYVSGTAFNLEQTLPVVLGFMVQLSESGLKGSLAGTSLNVAMLNMVKNLQKMQDALPGYQLEYTANGVFDFTKSLQKLFDLTKDFSTIERVQIFQDIFNIRGARAVTSSREIERIKDFINQISSAGNEARLASKTMDSGVGGAWRRATSALDDLGKTIGTVTAPAFKALFESVAPVTAILDRMVREAPMLTLAITAMPFALIAAGAGFLTLSFAMRKAAGAVGLLLSVYRPLADLFVRGSATQLGMLGFTRRARKGAAAKTSLGQLRAFGSGALSLPGKGAAYVANQKKAFDYSIIANRAMRRSQNAAMVARMMKARGVATPAQIAAQQAISARALAVSQRAGSMAASLKGPGLFTSIGRGLTAMAKGFWAVTRGITKFVFSFSGIFTIIEVLILFGDKIPFISGGLERLGRGFTLAFGEIGRIIPLLQGPLKLFFESLGFLQAGDGAEAQTGLNGLVTSLKLMGSIIYNQLVAAWERLVIAVAPFYDVVRKIVLSLYEVVALTIQMGSAVAAGRFSAVSDLFSGSGAASWNAIFQTFVEGLGYFIKGIFDFVDYLANVFDGFIYDFQRAIISLGETFRLMWESTANQKRAEASAIKMRQDVEYGQRKIDRNTQLQSYLKRVSEIFAYDTAKEAGKAGGAAKARANSASEFGFQAAEAMKAARQQLEAQKELMQKQMERQGQQLANPAASSPGSPKAQKAQMDTLKQVLSTSIDALVGSAHETRGNLYKKAVTTEEALNKIKSTNENMDKNIEKLVESKVDFVFGG